MERSPKPLFVATAVGVVAVAAVLLIMNTLRNDDAETTIVLSQREVGGPCAAGFKQATVNAKRGKQVTWEIQNFCAAEDDLLVVIGNFRATETTATNTNCADGTAGGARWPFTQSTEQREREDTVRGMGTTRKPGKGRIRLTIQDTEAAVGSYAYDVCIGTVKIDPVLVIER